MDLFEALIGEGPSTPERQRMLADQLRKKSRYGQLGVLTGDKQMGAIGSNLMVGADNDARTLQGIRRSGIDDARQSARDASDVDYRDRALKQSLQIAGMNNARAREIAQLTRDSMGQTRLDKSLERQQSDKDKKRVRLGEYMERNAMTALVQSVGDLNNLVGQYKGKNIPGVGGIQNTFVGKMNPSFDAKNMQSARASVVNAILRAQSGLAVTTQEAERMMEEMSGTPFSSDATFLAAVERINEKLNSRLQGLKATYGHDVVDEYMQDGGLMAIQGGASSQGQAPPMQGSGAGQPMPSTPSSAAPQGNPAAPQPGAGMSRLEYLRRKRDGLDP